MDGTYHLKDPQVDVLSHPRRRRSIHVLTLDPILATDVCERIHHDSRMKHYQLIRPGKTEIREAVEEIDGMARDTVSSRLLIIDVRRATLPKLQRAYNKVVGYNRRDLNKLCYVILIGDGIRHIIPTPHMKTHRLDLVNAISHCLIDRIGQMSHGQLLAHNHLNLREVLLTLPIAF